MTSEEITDIICNGDVDEYIDMLGEFSETLEDCIWMLKQHKQYNENDIYETLEKVRTFCRCIDSDSRGTGTLLKHLGI